MTGTRIFIISDLDWADESKEIELIDISKFSKTGKVPIDKRFNTVNYLLNLINSFNPSIILFPGDVTGDGSCGHGFHYGFLLLLKILERNKIHSIFIKGNHDIDKYYEIVMQETKQSAFIHEISLLQKTISGINFFGLSFTDSCSKTSLNKFSKSTNSIDILLAHSDLKSRPFLFDYDTSLICTGHSDYKLCFIDGKAFISLFNQFPLKNYCLIDFKTPEDYKVKYFYEMKGKTYYLSDEAMKQKISTWTSKDSFLILTGEKHKDSFKITSAVRKSDKTNNSLLETANVKNINNEEYRFVMEKLLKVKRNKEIFLTQNDINTMTKLWAGDYQISKTMILNYLGTSKIKKTA